MRSFLFLVRTGNLTDDVVFCIHRFILSAQDEKKGGIADRPDDEPDVYHTFFGLAALSLMGFPGIKQIDPVFALPTYVCERLGVMRTAPDGSVEGRT